MDQSDWLSLLEWKVLKRSVETVKMIKWSSQVRNPLTEVEEYVIKVVEKLLKG